MIRKIIFTLLVVVLSFGFLTGAKSSVLTAEEYREEIVKLEQEIEDLQKEIDILKNDILKFETEYKELEEKFDGLLKKEDMYNWLNQCNIYNVRANMKIDARHYNTNFIGMVTKEETHTGSGFIFCEDGNTKYVLTTYYLTNDKGYKKISYTLYDAFQTKYTATLLASSQEYGIAVLKFTDSLTNDLYVAPLAKADPVVGDPVCNIYSLNNSAYNHINFSKVKSYDSTSYYTFDVFTNDVDTESSVYGSMSVDLNGNVVGIVSLTSTGEEQCCKSIPVTKIIEYLLTIGFEYNS